MRHPAAWCRHASTETVPSRRIPLIPAGGSVSTTIKKGLDSCLSQPKEVDRPGLLGCEIGSGARPNEGGAAGPRRRRGGCVARVTNAA